MLTAPMRNVRLLLALSSALVAPACGGAAPAPVAPPRSAAVAPAPPPPDLSAVEAPAALVLSGRVARPSAVFATVRGWTKLPMPESEQLTELLTTEAIGPVLDLEQSLDFAIAVEGKGVLRPAAAVSGAVKDPDRVRASLGERYKLVPGDNGITLIEGLGRRRQGSQDGDDQDADPQDDDETRTCELSPAYGAAPVRIVCGTSRRALADLGPWLTRTAPRAPVAADLHVEVRLAPIKPVIDQQKRFAGLLVTGMLGGGLRSGAGPSLLGALVGDAADFASDLDEVSVDVTLADSGAQLTASGTLSGTSSVLGRIAASHPERSGAPPAAFWQLPADADAASFERGIDDALVAPARDLALDAVASDLTERGAATADVKAITASLGKLATSASAVGASGVDVAALRKAVSAEKALRDGASPAARDEAHRATAEQALGWHLLEVDAPSATFAGAIKELAAAMGRPAFAAALRAHDRGAVPPVLRSAPVAKASGLPPGSAHWVLQLTEPPRRSGPGAAPKTPAPPPRPILVHLFVSGDAAHAWLGAGGDEATVAAKLALALGGAGDKLSTRTDLASLHDVKVGAAGVLGPRAFPALAVALRALGGGTIGPQALDELEGMPNRGTAPIVLSVTAQPGGPPAVVVGAATVPRAVIEDFVTAILRQGGF